MMHQRKKTQQPLLPSTILFRKTLIHKLEDALTPSSNHPSARCKLVLLRAPAGYGKTTLLADFFRRSQYPVGWYFLEQSDTHPLIFLKTFTALLCHKFPALEREFSTHFLENLASTLLSEDQQRRSAILDLYIGLLERHIACPFVVCFCDYHKINKEKAIQRFLNHLLMMMPANLSLVIESRAIPALDLASLLAHRQLLGLGSDTLRFSAQEIREFSTLQQDSSITEEEAEQLIALFDGWISGMLVATRLGNIHAPLALHISNHRHSPAPYIDREMLLSYVKNEIFEQEPEALAFLQKTSLLQSLTAPQCNELLQIEDAGEYLTYIERQGLFLTRIGSEGSYPVYTLYPLLRQLFYEELYCTQTELTIVLHQRMAQLYFTLEDYEQAMMHAEKAQNHALIEKIIISAMRSKKGEQREQEKIASWIDALPDPIRERQPYLLFIRATLYLKKHEHIQAIALLDKAQKLVSLPSFPLGTNALSTLQAEIALAQSGIIFQKGDYIQTEQLCSEALKHLPADETDLRIFALIRLGICKALSGDYTSGITQLQQALQLNGYHMTTEQAGYIHSCLANIYSMMCNYALSEHHREQAIAIYEQLQLVQGKIKNLIWMAILKRNKGELDEAEIMLQRIVTMAQQEALPGEEAYAFFNLGANYVDKGYHSQALAALEKSLDLAHQTEDNRLVDQCLSELAMTYLFMDDVHMALLLLDQTTIASTDKVGYETSAYELARNTILLYQKDYERASIGFRALEPLAQRMQLKRTQIECLIRLAACQQALGFVSEMEASMEKVADLASRGHFEHIPIIELRRMPNLRHAIQSLSDLACLNAWRSSQDEASRDHSTSQEEVTSPDGMLQIKPFHAEGLHIQAFGEPTVMINGAPVRWHMALSMELYFFLLDYDRPIRKEQLIEIIWPGDKEYIDQTLRSAIHYLRKVIGKPCVSFSSGAYTLDQHILYGDSIWYDVHLFQQHAASARHAFEAGQDEFAKEHLQAMIQLYQGDYVQSSYNDWCIFRRDELRRSYMDARRQLAHMAWDNEQTEESIQHWQHLLAIDNSLEEAHYGLMRCYARQGKRGLAAKQYQSCVDILQQELAIAPGPAIQKLYQRLMKAP